MRLNQRVCTVVAAAVVCGIVFAGRPASAQTQIQAGQVIISEFRLRGPSGAEDEFVELYNNTDQPITVQALDQSAGWSVVFSNGQVTGPLFTVPNGTVIPARGHFLGANSNGYSLCNYPSGYGPVTNTTAPLAAAAAPCLTNGVAGTFTHTTPDRTWDFDVADGSGVALFATASGTNLTAANRLDAAGFTASPALYKEGAGFPTVVTSGLEHTYYRDLRNATPKDTGDNAADFLLVATTTNLQITRLGAPGPENLASPVVNNTTIIPTLLDPSVSSASSPNRERNPTPEPNATFGTMLIRRTITNNTGQPISRLRFRVIIITTLGTPAAECPAPSCADLRALTSQGGTATLANSQVVPVLGLRLEEPPAQPAGGGYNASLSADTITFATPLPDGLSINVEFKLGIQRTGPFRFFLNAEAQNGGDSVAVIPRASGVDASGSSTDVRKGRLIVDTVQAAPTAAAPSAAPVAAPRNAYAPWFITLTRRASGRTRAAEEETDREAEEKKSEEAAADDAAPPSSPAATRRGAPKKAPAPAKATRRAGR
jgi:hypothetical protein